MYQVLTYFFLKGKKQNCLSLFVSCFFSYNGSGRKAKEEAFSVELLLQTSRQYCAVITLKQNTALSRDFERGFVYVSVWSGFTCTEAQVWQSGLIKKMSFCVRLNHASICSMKNRVKINMSLVMCCNKGSPEHAHSSLRLSKTHPCHLSHCECVSAGSPPDSLLVLSDTKCVPALWRLIAPGSLVRVMPALNTNEHIRIAVFSSLAKDCRRTVEFVPNEIPQVNPWAFSRAELKYTSVYQ